jgi:hypothetical protein
MLQATITATGILTLPGIFEHTMPNLPEALSIFVHFTLDLHFCIEPFDSERLERC